VWVFGLLALLTAPAGAADTVLYATDAEAALARVAEDTGRPPEELVATTLPTLLSGRPPLLIGGGALETCAGEPAGPEAFQQALSAAESSMAFMEYGQALSELEEAAGLLGCLATPADPEAASRLHYLRGLCFFFADEPEAARAAWVQAHRFHPGLRWDDNFPPDGQAVFEAARALVDADQPATLAIIPALASDTLWLDGRLVPLEAGGFSIPAGTHLVQLGSEPVTTVQLQLAPGSSNTLVLPGTLPADAVAWIADETLRPVVSAALEVALGTGARVYAVSDGVTWTGTAGGTSWEALEQIPTPVPEPVEPVLPGPHRKRTWYVFTSGAAVGALAGVTALVSYVLARDAYRDAGAAQSVAIYKAEEDRFLRARRRYRIASWVAVGGAGVAAVGLAVPLGEGSARFPRAPTSSGMTTWGSGSCIPAGAVPDYCVPSVGAGESRAR